MSDSFTCLPTYYINLLYMYSQVYKYWNGDKFPSVHLHFEFEMKHTRYEQS